MDFPGGRVDKNPPTNSEDTGSILVWEDSTCHRAAQEPQLLSLCAAATAAHVPRACVLQEEKPPTATKTSPCSLQLQKARATTKTQSNQTEIKK